MRIDKPTIAKLDTATNGVVTTSGGDGTISIVAQSTIVPFTIDTGAGGVNVIVGTFTPAIVLADGVKFVIELVNTVTSGTPTCNANGTGAKTIVNNDETGTAIQSGQLVKGGRYTLSYDNTLGKYKVLNPTPIAIAYFTYNSL